MKGSLHLLSLDGPDIPYLLLLIQSLFKLCILKKSNKLAGGRLYIKRNTSVGK